MNKAVLKDELVGRVIDGKFPLVEWLGGSGQDPVFRTEVAGAGSRRAVIKLFRADGEAAKARLLSWELASGISHPHLMRVLASGRVRGDGGDMVYVVTEFAEEALSQIIPERALTPAEVGEMLPPVVEALSFLHGRGLVYGELRPSNILVVDNQVKLPLEGLARAGTLTPKRAAIRIYDAPESGALNAAPAADAWSLGATIVEALTQRQPVWNRSSNTDPAVPASIPAPFAEIARRCLRRDPARRLSVGQVKAVLGGAPLPPETGSEAKTAKTDGTPVKAPVAVATKAPAPVSAPAAAGTATKAGPVAIEERGSAAASSPRATNPARPAPAAVASLSSLRDPDEPASSSLNLRLWVLLGLAVVVLSVIGLLVTRSHKGSSGTSAEQQTTVPAPAPSEGAPAVRQSPAAAAPTSSGSKGDVANRVEPDVPERALRTVHGTIDITARLHVDADGSVSGATLEHRGPSHYFATRALDAAKKWKFKAPQQDGHPVASEWNLHFAFRRSGIETTPAQVRP